MSDDLLSRLDLSCITALMVGAEPIRYSALQMFTERFVSAGFSANVYMTAYGMAENVLHAVAKKYIYTPTSPSLSASAFLL